MNDVRYSPGDFEEFVLEETQPRLNGAPPAEVVIGPLDLKADAIPPLDAFMELMDTTKFRATFERRRRDLQDQSPSAYDMALVSAAVRAGWNDQDTANLVIYGRKKHVGGVEKALRLDYMTTMLRKVRQGIEQDTAATALEDRFVEQRAGVPQEMGRDELLSLVRQALQINVLGITKYGNERADFELVTDRGTVVLGKVDGLIGHLQLRNAIASTCGQYIQDFSRARWRAVAQALLDLCEEKETGEATTDQGRLGEWLEAYLVAQPADVLSEDRILTRRPITGDDGAPLIFLDSLSLWLFHKRGEQVTARWLAREMRRRGSLPVALNCEVGGKRTTREVWPVR